MASTFLTRTGLLILALWVTSFAAPALAEGTVRLNFGVYSSNKPSALVRMYRPVLKELERNMTQRLNRDVDIRMQIAKDYDQGISHLINGRVDFSLFGPASYLEAKRMNEDIRILAVENVNDSKVFYGIIAVAKDSPLQDITELRGKSFAFGDEGSTIGRFLSQLELEQAGIRAGDLSRYEYLGRHDKVGTAVGAGDFDAGALNEKTFKKLTDAGEPIRELTRFPNVTKPWIARSGLDDEIHEALRASLLQITDKSILAALKIDGFLEGGDEDYRVIRRAMEDNGKFFEERETADLAQRSEPAVEPAMQAAVSAPEKQMDISQAIMVQHGPEVIQSTTTSGNANHLTINLQLPRAVFESAERAHAITINLIIPDEATTGSNASVASTVQD